MWEEQGPWEQKALSSNLSFKGLLAMCPTLDDVGKLDKFK